MKYVISLGTAALGLALLAFGAETKAQALSDWRAVVIDDATRALVLVDATEPKPVPVGPAVSGFIFEPGGSSHVVFLRSGSHATTATIFSQAPARTLGPISLGDCFFPNVGTNVGAPAGLMGMILAGALERRVIADVPDRLILSCEGMLVSLDLERGTAATQPAPKLTTLHRLDAERLLAVEAGGRDRSLTTELLRD